MSLRDQLIRNFNEAEFEAHTRGGRYEGARYAGLAGPHTPGSAARKLGAGIASCRRAKSPAPTTSTMRRKRCS
jgi:hypothetical protein